MSGERAVRTCTWDKTELTGQNYQHERSQIMSFFSHFAGLWLINFDNVIISATNNYGRLTQLLKTMRLEVEERGGSSLGNKNFKCTNKEYVLRNCFIMSLSKI